MLPPPMSLPLLRVSAPLLLKTRCLKLAACVACLRWLPSVQSMHGHSSSQHPAIAVELPNNNDSGVKVTTRQQERESEQY